MCGEMEMVKLGLKGIIFFMGIQSLFGRLQTEGIITGSIKINYSAIQHKIIDVITSDEVNAMIKNYENSEENQFYQAPRMVPKNDRVKVYHHVVQRGETLSNLGETYGVSWKVIKKANKIYNERLLQVGQDLVIPVLQSGMA